MALAEWRKKFMGEAKGLIAGYPIAIDFGAGSLKVLQIAAGEPPTLVAAAGLSTPDELLNDPAKRLTFQLEALPNLLKGVGFRGKRAVCALPAAHAYCKHMQFQPESGAPIASLVKSAVSAQFGCDPAALVFRHIEVGQVGRAGKTEVICMAARRDLVERLMRALKDAKLDPVGMHLEFTATVKAFDSITRRSEDAAVTSLYLDVGASVTKVTIAHGRELAFCRTIDLGGRHLDSAVAKQLKLTLAEGRAKRLQMAELIRRAAPAPERAPAGGGMAVLNAAMAKEGQPIPTESGAATAVLEERRSGQVAPGLTADLTAQASVAIGPPQADLSEPLEILTDEISMCLRYHDSIFPDRRVDRTIFIGGEARHVGLCQHIARTLKLPAQVADPMAGIARAGNEPTRGVDFRQAQPGWALALGLCFSPTDL